MKKTISKLSWMQSLLSLCPNNLHFWNKIVQCFFFFFKSWIFRYLKEQFDVPSVCALLAGIFHHLSERIKWFQCEEGFLGTSYTCFPQMPAAELGSTQETWVCLHLLATVSDQKALCTPYWILQIINWEPREWQPSLQMQELIKLREETRHSLLRSNTGSE